MLSGPYFERALRSLLTVKVSHSNNIEICSSPVFIVGCPRSGTSVIAWSLARHSKLWVSAESDFLAELIAQVKKIYSTGTRRGAQHWLVKEDISLEAFMMFAGLGINALYTKQSNSRRWIEQTPLYTMYIHEIGIMFPEVKFIHIIRDGRDVVNSMLKSGFPQKWSKDFTFACKTWLKYVNNALNYQKAFPHRICEIKLETLSDAPRQELTKVLAFIKLGFETGMAGLFNSKQRINSSFANDEERKERGWRNIWTEGQKDEFKKICGQLLINLGYEKNDSWN